MIASGMSSARTCRPAVRSPQVLSLRRSLRKRHKAGEPGRFEKNDETGNFFKATVKNPRMAFSWFYLATSTYYLDPFSGQPSG
jgi:hypothetical protein